MGMDLGVFVTYVGAILLIFVFGKIFYWPLRAVFKLILNSMFGGIVIILFNTVFAGLGLLLPLNVLNAFIIGILGLPGAAMLLLISL